MHFSKLLISCSLHTCIFCLCVQDLSQLLTIVVFTHCVMVMTQVFVWVFLYELATLLCLRLLISVGDVWQRSLCWGFALKLLRLLRSNSLLAKDVHVALLLIGRHSELLWVLGSNSHVRVPFDHWSTLTALLSWRHVVVVGVLCVNLSYFMRVIHHGSDGLKVLKLSCIIRDGLLSAILSSSTWQSLHLLSIPVVTCLFEMLYSIL